jgi:broad specificity phosphatase PhoE
MLLTLIRHGEVAGRPFVFRGRSDPALTIDGWAQLERAARAFDDPPVDRIVSSTSRRCSEFAGAWARKRNVGLRCIDALREIDFGAWEEMTPDEARVHDEACFEQFQRDPSVWRAPGGESYREFHQRVRTEVDGVLNSEAQHIGVITHAGVIRAVLCDALNMTPRNALRVALPPACICRLSYANDGSAMLLTLHGAPT